ncbi:hypothetical protein QR680_014978 [Steinernema hermaphroditum]|uniref:Secreted protein n=1 Tax=Steinernema hermaphroditum TaxID=289476 RepID=A0AA39IAQ5_9BILA|nr:hypothetical protein QR680_014978 [Steinernema hermaphroditum]
MLRRLSLLLLFDTVGASKIPFGERITDAVYASRFLASVKDKCWGCGRNKLDLSEPAFKALEKLAVGHVYGAVFTLVKC